MLSQSFLIATLALVAAAVWRAGRTEQAAALACLLATVGTAFLQNRADAESLQWGILTVDVALLVAVALASSKRWPLFAAAAQLLTTATHGADALEPEAGAWAVITVSYIAAVGVVLSVAAGVATARREPAPERASGGVSA